MKCRIGLLDADSSAREQIKAELQQIGCAFEVVFEHEDEQTTRIFINQASSCPLEILFVDIRMPDLAGIALIQQVKQIYPEIHFVITIGHDDYTYAKSALHLSEHIFLMKPFMKIELADTLTKVKNKILKEQIAKEVEYKNKIASWLTHRGSIDLHHDSEKYFLDKIAGCTNMYLVLIGNYHSSTPLIPNNKENPHEVPFVINICGFHHLMMYMHSSDHFASQIFRFYENSTATILHFSSIHSIKQLPELVCFGLSKIRDTLVLDEYIYLHIKPKDIIPDKHWSDVNKEHLTYIDKIKHEHRYEFVLEDLKRLLYQKLPQKVKEQAFQLFMMNIFRMEVSIDWLQSFDQSDQFTHACLDLINHVNFKT